MKVLAAFWLVLVVTQLASAQLSSPGPPKLGDYLVSQTYDERPADPIFATSEQRKYRTRIVDGVTKGRGVWIGSWKTSKERPGPNFAGHYFVIRWGCGSDCLMMAIVDAKSGKAYPPPLSGAGSELYLPMDPMSDREIDFRLDSTLMILRNACKDARQECGIYYFNWQNDHFDLVRRMLVDLTKMP